jgi:hypothetical protein
MTHDEMIAVIQACKGGKMIQGRVKGLRTWEDLFEPGWNFERCDYRVKPEPRVRWHAEWTNPDGQAILGTFGFDSENELFRSCNTKVRPIKFIEVLDDA